MRHKPRWRTAESSNPGTAAPAQRPPRAGSAGATGPCAGKQTGRVEPQVEMGDSCCSVLVERASLGLKQLALDKLFDQRAHAVVAAFGAGQDRFYFLAIGEANRRAGGEDR